MLKAMHRGYTAEKYLTLTEKLRAACPNIALTTDVIVGFPGESDEDYTATRSLVARVGFDNAFIFRYSPRRDTPASAMDGQVPEHVKEARNQDLLSVVDAWRRAGEKHSLANTWKSFAKVRAKAIPNRLSGRSPGNKIRHLRRWRTAHRRSLRCEDRTLHRLQSLRHSRGSLRSIDHGGWCKEAAYGCRAAAWEVRAAAYTCRGDEDECRNATQGCRVDRGDFSRTTHEFRGAVRGCGVDGEDFKEAGDNFRDGA
jgi:hypothetical protein